MVNAYDLLFELLGTGEENTGKRFKEQSLPHENFFVLCMTRTSISDPLMIIS